MMMMTRPLRIGRGTCNSKVLGYSQRRCWLASRWERNIDILDFLNEDFVPDSGGDSRVSFWVQTQMLERRVGEDTCTEEDEKPS